MKKTSSINTKTEVCIATKPSYASRLSTKLINKDVVDRIRSSQPWR